MRGGTPENLTSVAKRPENAEKMSKTSIAALKNIEKYAWPKGAILSCGVCLRSAEKTPEELQKYMKKWPRCCNVPANVKPKY